MTTDTEEKFNPYRELMRELSRTGVISHEFKSDLLLLARECLNHGRTRGLREAAKIAEENRAHTTAEAIMSRTNSSYDT